MSSPPTNQPMFVAVLETVSGQRPPTVQRRVGHWKFLTRVCSIVFHHALRTWLCHVHGRVSFPCPPHMSHTTHGTHPTHLTLATSVARSLPHSLQYTVKPTPDASPSWRAALEHLAWYRHTHTDTLSTDMLYMHTQRTFMCPYW